MSRQLKARWPEIKILLLTTSAEDQDLFEAVRTVRFHMAEIISRLHLQNRSQVLAYAGKLGLRPDD